jgi:hypothetical protein
VPISHRQERWDIYTDTGTRDRVRAELAPTESLSEFVRAAAERELRRRERVREQRAQRARLRAQRQEVRR